MCKVLLFFLCGSGASGTCCSLMLYKTSIWNTVHCTLFNMAAHQVPRLHHHCLNLSFLRRYYGDDEHVTVCRQVAPVVLHTAIPQGRFLTSQHLTKDCMFSLYFEKKEASFEDSWRSAFNSLWFKYVIRTLKDIYDVFDYVTKISGNLHKIVSVPGQQFFSLFIVYGGNFCSFRNCGPVFSLWL